MSDGFGGRAFVESPRFGSHKITSLQTCLPAEAPARAMSAAGGSAQAGECWYDVIWYDVMLN